MGKSLFCDVFRAQSTTEGLSANLLSAVWPYRHDWWRDAVVGTLDTHSQRQSGEGRARPEMKPGEEYVVGCPLDLRWPFLSQCLVGSL